MGPLTTEITWLLNEGHIGFLGHGSELKFRNIRIKNCNLAHWALTITPLKR